MFNRSQPPSMPGAPGSGMSMVQPHPVHPGLRQVPPPALADACKACAGACMVKGKTCGHCQGSGREPAARP